MSILNMRVGGKVKKLQLVGSFPPNLQEKTATENGEVIADEGYDGLSKVTVNVEGSGGGGAIDLSAIPEVDSIENPTATSPTAVSYNGEIYLLVEGELNNG